MGNPILITTSSTGLTSKVAALDWRAEKWTNFSLTLSSSQGSATATVQASLDDPMLVSSTSQVWTDVSSAIGLSSAGVLTSSIYSLTGSYAALRSLATAQSSTSLQLRILQGVGW
jgi:hypothetical protein